MSWPLQSLEPSGGDRHVHGQLQLSVIGSVLGTMVGTCRAMGEQMVQDRKSGRLLGGGSIQLRPKRWEGAAQIRGE